jgi:UDP-N-acetyl-D-galactosamine dehydrogenase
MAKIFTLFAHTNAVLKLREQNGILKFRSGLVGGHCIGVDPYYLAQKAQMPAIIRNNPGGQEIK